MQILILEASTSSAKAMVYNCVSGIVRLRTTRYDAQSSDVYTHDAPAVYEQLLAVGRQAAEGKKIDAVALVGTWHTTLLCDRHLQPLARAHLWSSTAAAQTVARVRADADLVQQLYRLTGCMAHTMFPLYHIRHLLESGQADENCLFSTEGAYFFHRLTGQWRTSQSTASGSGLLDIHTLRYAPLALHVAGVGENRLPALCTHTFTAPLADAPALLLGLPAGTPVCASHPDGAMNQLGSAALRPGCMTLSVGTSAAARLAVTSADTARLQGNWLYYAPESWLVGAATGATNNLDWFVRTLAPGHSFETLENTAGIRPDAPYYLPFLYGERCPGWNERRTAQFCGMRGDHTVQALYAAVQEGILYNLFQCYRQVCAAFGAPRQILLSGGILKSPLWTQMLADIFGREMTASDVSQASMLGGAAVALHAIGALPAPAAFSPPRTNEKTITPHPEPHALYTARFEGYLQHYAQQVIR